MALGFMRRHRRWLFVFLWLVIGAFVLTFNIPAFQDAQSPGIRGDRRFQADFHGKISHDRHIWHNLFLILMRTDYDTHGGWRGGRNVLLSHLPLESLPGS